MVTTSTGLPIELASLTTRDPAGIHSSGNNYRNINENVGENDIHRIMLMAAARPDRLPSGSRVVLDGRDSLRGRVGIVGNINCKEIAEIEYQGASRSRATARSYGDVKVSRRMYGYKVSNKAGLMIRWRRGPELWMHANRN